MANTVEVLRWNADDNLLEYASAGGWYAAISGSQPPPDGSITPPKISQTATNDFTFPRDITVTRDLIVGRNGYIPGNLRIRSPNSGGDLIIGDASSFTAATIILQGATGTQESIQFNNANSAAWYVLHQVDDTLLFYDNTNGHGWALYHSGVMKYPSITTTQKNAVASPSAGMVCYDSTLNKLCVYTGAAWETVAST